MFSWGLHLQAVEHALNAGHEKFTGRDREAVKKAMQSVRLDVGLAKVHPPPPIPLQILHSFDSNSATSLQCWDGRIYERLSMLLVTLCSWLCLCKRGEDLCWFLCCTTCPRHTTGEHEQCQQIDSGRLHELLGTVKGNCI